MKISIISIFPEFFKFFSEHSIIKKAIKNNLVSIETINPRDFAVNGKVDDYVYGGGIGMLLMIEPIVKALKSIKKKNSWVILTSPRGKMFSQQIAKNLSIHKHIIIICGHYEGIDARIKNYIDQEISIGEYILTSGELAAGVIVDSVTRLIPNVLKSEATQKESFENNLIECDQYTRPEKFMKYDVPKVLLSGNHKEINKWKIRNSYNNNIKYILSEKINKKEK